GVVEVREVDADFVVKQLITLLDDVRVDAVKVGMLANAPIIGAVADVLERYDTGYVVLDPVMVAKSGDRLLAAAAVAALRERLMPRADLVTPNLSEAADLLGEHEAADEATMVEQAHRLLKRGARRVLLKGGHMAGSRSRDLLVDENAERWFDAPRIDTPNTHGTGCTLSSAIATLRPQRESWSDAVTDAKSYLTEALRTSDRLTVGHGHGPVHHLHRWMT
ncbi:MAG: bifunctional hydroxymethylpyrimidine kinase/phosphomethylpyrimidine kinase, partial [Mycobacteriales bacterium]